MHRRSMSVMALVLVGLILAGSAGANIIGWWKFDGNYEDSSGNGNNGTAVGAPTFAAGQFGQAVNLNASGSNQYISCGTRAGFSTIGEGGTAAGMTLAVWINRQNTTADMKICGCLTESDWAAGHGFQWGIYNNLMELDMRDSVNRYFSRDYNSSAFGVAPTFAANTWYHVAMVFDDRADTLMEYSNGQLGRTWPNVNRSLRASTTEFKIGSETPTAAATRVFQGLMDDLRVYDSPLNASDVRDAMAGLAPDSGVASAPQPADEASDVARDIALSWKSGRFAATHNVYFGTVFDDVNAATPANPRGVLVAQQDVNAYDPPGVLDYGQTYYWRVDEVNAPPTASTVFRGAPWRFTVEPVLYAMTDIKATASGSYSAASGPEKTIDGSGLNAADQHSTDSTTMWISGKTGPHWIQYEFVGVYKLQYMWVWNSNQTIEPALGFGVKTATVEYSADGVNWTALSDVPEFKQAPGFGTYVHDTTIDFGGVPAKFVKITPTSSWGGWPQYSLSEVRFFYTPVLAREPEPAPGTTGVSPDVTLRWRAGREAVSHQVYIGSDPDALALAGTTSVTSFAPAGLTLGTQYSWRVDEVNAAEALSTWASPAWTFTTADYVVVDDMESYTDVDGAAIYNTWADGYGAPATNGALVGYDVAPFTEKTTIHGGRQAMPFRYGQSTATTSEVTRTFAGGQDWTKAGVKTLTLFFYGDPNNGAASLYVKINGTKIAYDGDAGNIQRWRWTQWNIDLSALAASTVRSVNSLLIGVSGTGKGTLFVDDIRLYRSAPAVPVPVNPGTTGLIAYYAMNNNVQDSSGNGNHGTLLGTPTYVAGLSAFGMALRLNGTTDSVNLGNKPVFNPAGSFSVSLWAYSTLWSTTGGHVMIGNRGENSIGWQVRRYSGTTSMSFTTRGVGNDDMQSVGAMPQNEWVHITCVYDHAGNTKRIYMNGIEDSMLLTTPGASIAATTHNTYIGARANVGNTGTEAWFTGLLDEVRLFSRALSAGEAEYLSDPTP